MTSHPAPAPGETPTPRTSAKVEELSVMVCNCGSPLNGSHDHNTCGEPQRQWMAGAEEGLEAHARALERENQRLREALEAAKLCINEAWKMWGTCTTSGQDILRHDFMEKYKATLTTGGTADAVKEGCSHKSTRLEHSASGNESQLVCNQCGEAITPME